MGIIKYVTHQFIVEAETIVEFACLKRRIAELFADFRFHRSYFMLYRTLLQMVSDDEDIKPAILVLNKKAGDNDQFKLPRGRKLASNLITLKHAGIKKESL